MAGMRRVEPIVKTAHQRRFTLDDTVGENAVHLLRQRIFLHAIAVEKTGLRCPADVHRGKDVLRCPIHDGFELFPIEHFFKVHLFHRCSRDDQSVKIDVLHFFEGFIKRFQVFQRRVARKVRRGAQKGDFHLKGSVAQDAQQLGFGHDLGGH